VTDRLPRRPCMSRHISAAYGRIRPVTPRIAVFAHETELARIPLYEHKPGENLGFAHKVTGFVHKAAVTRGGSHPRGDPNPVTVTTTGSGARGCDNDGVDGPPGRPTTGLTARPAARPRLWTAAVPDVSEIAGGGRPGSRPPRRAPASSAPGCRHDPRPPVNSNIRDITTGEPVMIRSLCAIRWRKTTPYRTQ